MLKKEIALHESLMCSDNAWIVRKANLRAIQAQISPENYVQEVLGDGACLFCAFSRSLQ